MEEITIPAHFIPRPLSSLQLRGPDYILVAVRSGKDWQFNPQDAYELQPGHVLVAMTTPAGRREVEQAVT
jgi:voltage-gated potassium channel